MTGLDYLTHLAADTRRFGEVLDGVPSDRRVPSCPDWDADDLVWHLTEVQWFWSQVVGRRLVSSADVDALVHPVRPASRAELHALQRQSAEALHQALSSTPPETVCWSWAPDQTAGFSRRRQAHEALIHRIDAELTAEDRSPVDPALAADGIDEVLTLMYAAEEPVGEDRPTVAVRTLDTGHRWWMRVGDPELGLQTVRGADAVADAEVVGSAADLDAHLWNRTPVESLMAEGDPVALAAFAAMIDRGVH